MIGEIRKKYIELVGSDSDSLVFGPRISGKTTMAIYEALYRMNVLGEDVIFFVNKCFRRDEMERVRNLLIDNFSEINKYSKSKLGGICFFRNSIEDMRGSKRCDRIIFDDSYVEFKNQVNNDRCQGWQFYADAFSGYGEHGTFGFEYLTSCYHLINDSYYIYKNVPLYVSPFCPRCLNKLEKKISCGLFGDEFEIMKCNKCGYC